MFALLWRKVTHQWMTFLERYRFCEPKNQIIRMSQLKKTTNLIKLPLGQLFELTNVRHRESVPTVHPTEHFTMELRKQARILLK
jgi:hypothetical protein